MKRVAGRRLVGAVVGAFGLTVAAVFTQSASAATLPASVSAHAPAAPATTIGKGHVKPTIVLEHGAWADASGWAQVTQDLQRLGYTVYAPANPLRGLKTDSAYLSRFLAARATGPVILVGHSYGGAVITNSANTDRDVKALVYVDAFAPKKGESLLQILSAAGPIDASALFDAVPLPGGDADLYLKTSVFPVVFANGIPARTAAQMATSQRPLAASALTDLSGRAAWAHLPSFYVLGTLDRIIPPAIQQSMATRAHSKVIKVAAGHLSMITKPLAVTAAIVAADLSTR
jgi:pimeloyl-ACP methyl ester carboxylesterase